MNIVANIQARMSSTRLVGKMLLDINGRPLLSYLIESLKQCTEIDGLVVATSNQSEDDAIEEFCSNLKVNCFRGDLENTANRLLKSAVSKNCEAIVRVNGDSPLMDYRLIDKGSQLMRSGRWDLVTNTQPRTFPHGMSVEVIRTSALENAEKHMSVAYQREHVTPYFYDHSQEFRIRSFTSMIDFGHFNFCVDTEQDLIRISAILDGMDRPHWQYGYEDIIHLVSGAINLDAI